MDNYSHWQNSWKDGKAYWHNNKPHPDLVKYFQELTNGQKDVKVLFPLCGKAVDMMWVYGQGHRIVGVEAVEQPVQEFFSENKLQYSKIDCPIVDGELYQTRDGRLKIFRCDLFNFNSESDGLMDAVWDRGSFVAIKPYLRIRYGKLMHSLMAEDFQYLLSTVRYDPTPTFNGPPHSVENDEVYSCFKPWKIVLLEHKFWQTDGGTDDDFLYRIHAPCS
ncbi:TPMT (predicted) [Pycnogonum litorale]